MNGESRAVVCSPHHHSMNTRRHCPATHLPPFQVLQETQGGPQHAEAEHVPVDRHPGAQEVLDVQVELAVGVLELPPELLLDPVRVDLGLAPLQPDLEPDSDGALGQGRGLGHHAEQLEHVRVGGPGDLHQQGLELGHEGQRVGVRLAPRSGCGVGVGAGERGVALRKCRCGVEGGWLRGGS